VGNKLPANSNFDIFIKIFFFFAFPYLLDWETHFFSRFLDEEEESLDINIIHNLDVQDLIDELNSIDFNVGVAPDGAVGLVSKQHSDELDIN